MNGGSVLVDLIAVHGHKCRRSGEPFSIAIIGNIFVFVACFTLVWSAWRSPESLFDDLVSGYDLDLERGVSPAIQSRSASCIARASHVAVWVVMEGWYSE